MKTHDVSSLVRQVIVWLIRLPWWLTAVVLFLLFFARSIYQYDYDFGWHIAAGEYIRESGIPANDIFTYTAQSFEWVNHEWLADVATSYLYDIGGFTLLAILHALAWTGALLIASKGIQYRAVTVLAAVVVLPYAGVRSLTTSVVLATALMVLMRSRRLYWLLVPLFALWANIHGSFVLGLAYVFFETMRLYRHEIRRFAVAIAAVAATFANPYGWRIYEEVLRTAADSSLGSRITEWAPWQLDPLFGVFVGVWGAVLLLSSKRWSDVIRFDTLLLAMSVLSGRHQPLFVLFALPTLAQFRLNRQIKFREMWEDTRLRVAAVLLSIVAFASLVFAAGQFVYFPAKPDFVYPTEIVNYLEQNPCEGNVFNHYDFGGYLIWQLPGVPVYIDGRMPSWSNGSEKYMDNYLEVIADSDFREREFARYDVQCVVWYDDAFAKKLTDDGWSRTLADPGKFVLLEKP